MPQYLLYLIIIFTVIYLINILRFIMGINRRYEIPLNKELISISVIVAVKNGGENIKRLLDALSHQTYQGDMEFIIVDDNSMDDTREIICDYSKKDSRFKYLSSNEGSNVLNHKKKALDAGIKSSQHEYLLFTDIDCIIQSKWVESMSACFSKDTDYIIGLTYINDNKTILNKFQCIDLFMLLFASYSSVSLHTPWASSGQNQAYTKSLYNSLGGFESIAKCLQGDDTLFLQLARKKGATVVFNDLPGSYVISRTEKKWKNLLLQRARWSGDANMMWKFNIFFYMMAVATFIINSTIIILIFTPYFKISLSILLFKLLLEIIMYYCGSIKFQRKVRYIDFITWFLIVPLYTVLMGICSFFNIKWKGKSVV